MSGVAIVAIPRQDDYVWKISSEKIPHMTLLFLGEMTPGPEFARIETFLSHVASTSMHRFGMSVDRRGKLGPDKADVLFFQKEHSRMIREARDDLLKNSDIRAAYESTQQYPEWTPHLTLGYPATPAKPDTRDYPITWVEFDTVAFWVDNFDGPTIRLEDQNGMDFTMSDLGVSPVLAGVELAHHGVKGMKWGVRREHITSSFNNGKVRVKQEFHQRSGDEVIVRTKPGHAVQVVGGNNRNPHEDAIAARKAEQLAKRNTLDALSNQDLQKLVTRMNLEQQYRNLAVHEDRLTAGEKFAQKMIKQFGETHAKRLGPLAPTASIIGETLIGTSNKAFTTGSSSANKKK